MVLSLTQVYRIPVILAIKNIFDINWSLEGWRDMTALFPSICQRARKISVYSLRGNKGFTGATL